MIKEYNVQMYKVSETFLPIYINGQCPVIKTCSDVTLNLSSKDSIMKQFLLSFSSLLLIIQEGLLSVIIACSSLPSENSVVRLTHRLDMMTIAVDWDAVQQNKRTNITLVGPSVRTFEMVSI